LVAIIGTSDAGKTSLIASLYDLFQLGPIGSTEFARSQTLHALEEACHDARAASRRLSPEMRRTPLGGVHFYHFDLCTEDHPNGLTLLLGDRAGEEYRAVSDDIRIAQSLIEIRRADSLALLVDGERLLDLGQRHNLQSDIILIVQGLADGGILTSGRRLALVLTKFDLIEGSSERARVESDFERLRLRLCHLFGKRIPTIRAFTTAAFPKSGTAIGRGVPDLLKFWLETEAMPALTLPPIPISARAIGRLRRRT
jgi:hypothetical protein